MYWKTFLSKQALTARTRGVVYPTQKSRDFSWFSEEQLLSNDGSVARDVLAAERTFLAWARTGLGFVGAGSALFAAWHEQEQNVAPSASLLIANGAFLLVFATRRYLRVLQSLQHNQFPLDVKGTLSAVFLTAIGTSTSLGLVAWTEFGFRQRRDPQQNNVEAPT